MLIWVDTLYTSKDETQSSSYLIRNHTHLPVYSIHSIIIIPALLVSTEVDCEFDCDVVAVEGGVVAVVGVAVVGGGVVAVGSVRDERKRCICDVFYFI